MALSLPISGHHRHGRAHVRQGRSLTESFALSFEFAVAESVCGLIANSQALVADAVNDDGDTVAPDLSCLGLKLSERWPSCRRTFGYGKVQVLTAFIVRAAMWHLPEDSFGRVGVLVGGITIRQTAGT
jgi:cobalt-zinc-cadmium efflux system protein